MDGPGGEEGDEINLSKLFQFDAGFLPMLSGQFRFSEKTLLHGEWLNIGRSGQATLQETIEWDGVEYEIGATVKSDFNLDIYRLFFGYDLFRNEKSSVGLGAGLHILKLKATLKGQASINGESIGEAKTGFSDWAPLPNIGFYANYAFSPRWLISGRLDWFAADVGDYSGSLSNANASIQYQLWNHLGIGIGYRYFNLNISAKSNDWRGSTDTGYDGATLFITTNF